MSDAHLPLSTLSSSSSSCDYSTPHMLCSLCILIHEESQGERGDKRSEKVTDEPSLRMRRGDGR
ncbi:hypothetical protein E2C01_089151 [Portunus trituberculatus]|uniref:Uncharacterized protein n=1 Tax=Portunus trituberculatus TaxID=210409 RepID=A0A5B7J812_PORTR|nr:hypothetical protein [Portunus trituberculatus]